MTGNNGGVHIEVRGEHEPSLLTDLRAAIEAVVPLMIALAKLQGVTPPETRWLVCDNFAVDVATHLETPFSTDRLGGQVSAKTMWEKDRIGRVIALNSGMLLNVDDPRNPADQVFLVGHEFAHVLQEAIRADSGVMQGVPVPSETIGQSWRSIIRIAADEYRADLLGAQMLAHLVGVGDSDARRPASIADTWALNHLAACEQVVQGLHPALPDLVQRYREWSISLDDMLRALARYTEDTLTMLAHWQATCDLLEISDQWGLGLLPSLPATRLYVRPTWDPIHNLIGSQSALPTPAELLELEPELLDVGAAAIERMWAVLGVTVTDSGPGNQRVDVVEPTR